MSYYIVILTMHEYLAVFYIPNLENEMINCRIENSWGRPRSLWWYERKRGMSHCKAVNFTLKVRSWLWLSEMLQPCPLSVTAHLALPSPTTSIVLNQQVDWENATYSILEQPGWPGGPVHGAQYPAESVFSRVLPRRAPQRGHTIGNISSRGPRVWRSWELGYRLLGLKPSLIAPTSYNPTWSSAYLHHGRMGKLDPRSQQYCRVQPARRVVWRAFVRSGKGGQTCLLLQQWSLVRQFKDGFV